MSAPTGGWIVSRRYDLLWFLAPPFVGLALGLAIGATGFARSPFLLWSGEEVTFAGLAIGALIHAHLVAVFARSHGNPEVRRRHRIAFFVVPPLLFAAIVLTAWGTVLALVVATFWDVWHSGAQAFGFARIYDARAGNDPKTLRRLDFVMHQLLYAGPIFAGAALMDHVSVLEDFGDLEGDVALWLARGPGVFEAHRAGLMVATLAAMFAVAIVYGAAVWRARRRGYRLPWQKTACIVGTGLCATVAWGFNSWGEAFFIMNFFHAVQYLALVWAKEGPRLAERMRLGGRPPLALAAFLAIVFGYGAAVVVGDPEWHVWWALTMTVSLLHFAYDAFIWSVRRAEV